MPCKCFLSFRGSSLLSGVIGSARVLNSDVQRICFSFGDFGFRGSLLRNQSCAAGHLRFAASALPRGPRTHGAVAFASAVRSGSGVIAAPVGALVQPLCLRSPGILGGDPLCSVLPLPSRNSPPRLQTPGEEIAPIALGGWAAGRPGARARSAAGPSAPTSPGLSSPPGRLDTSRPLTSRRPPARSCSAGARPFRLAVAGAPPLFPPGAPDAPLRSERRRLYFSRRLPAPDTSPTRPERRPGPGYVAARGAGGEVPGACVEGPVAAVSPGYRAESRPRRRRQWAGPGRGPDSGGRRGGGVVRPPPPSFPARRLPAAPRGARGGDGWAGRGDAAAGTGARGGSAHLTRAGPGRGLRGALRCPHAAWLEPGAGLALLF